MRIRNLFVLPVTAALLCTFGTGFAYASGSTYTWIGSSQSSGGDGHSWTDANNWSPAGVPGDGDSVEISEPDDTHCTAHVDGVPTVSLVDLQIASTRCGTTVTGGQFTVTGEFTWNGGTLDTPTTIAAGATGEISGSNSHLDVLTQDLSVGGSLTLTGLSGSGASNTGALRIDAPQHLHVLSGGTLESQGSNDLRFSACCVNPARIVNDGTIDVEGGVFDVDAVAIDQNGKLEVNDGALLSDGDPITAADGARYTGNGSWQITDLSIARLSGTQNLGTAFDLQLSAVNGDDPGARLGGTATLAGTGTFDWAGGTVEGNLTIAHGVTMKLSGAHTGNGHRVLYGQDGTGTGDAVPSTLTNHGTIRAENAAAFTTGGPARLVNASDGTVSLAPGTQTSSISCCVNPDKFTNKGKLVVTTGTSSDPVDLDNFAYQATGGSTSIAAGRQLLLSGGAPNKLSNTSVTGGGTLALAEPAGVDGTVTIDSHTRLALQPQGTLDGTATLTGAGSLRWSGGSMSGKLTVAPHGGISVTGADTKYIANINGGSKPSSVTLRAPTTIGPGTTKTRDTISMQQSTLTLASSTTIAEQTDIDGGTLVNTGSLTVDPGKSGEVDRTGTDMTNRGTVTVKSGTFLLGDAYTQAAGVTTVAKGARLNLIFVTRTVAVTGGTLQGEGSIGAGVSNTGGTVRPGGSGSGTLRIAGGYTQGKKGRLEVDLGAKSHDVLAVVGSASLKGSLATHNHSGYHPKGGAHVTIATAHPMTTGLNCVTTSGTASSGKHAGHWAAGHTATKVTLTWKSGARKHC